MRSWVQQNANYLSAARIELRQSLRLQTREALDFSRGRLHEAVHFNVRSHGGRREESAGNGGGDQSLFHGF